MVQYRGQNRKEDNQETRAIIQAKDSNSTLGGCNEVPKQVKNFRHFLAVRPSRPVERLQVEHDVEKDLRITSKFIV